MNDASLIKGVISAYDARTGKVIFEKIHNVVMAWEKAFLLSRVIGVTNMTDIYVPSGSEVDTKLQSMLQAGDASGKVTSFDVGFDGSSTYPTEEATKSIDLVKPIGNVGFFSADDPYCPSDISATEKAKKIIYTPEQGAFARMKLHVEGSMVGDVSDAGFLANGQDINFVALKNSNGIYLTQFRFPAICFYSNTSVDFEYRIYL